MNRPGESKVGYSGRRIGKQIMRHSIQIAELIFIIQEELADSALRYRRTFKALNELALRNTHLHDVGAGLADADMHETEAAGKRMAGETEQTA